MLCYLCVEAVVQHSSHTPPKGLQLWNFCKVDILVGNLCNICCILPHHLKKIWENMRKYEKVRKFVYVGKIPYFRQVLLNSRLHSSLVTLAETFSIPRTDSLHLVISKFLWPWLHHHQSPFKSPPGLKDDKEIRMMRIKVAFNLWLKKILNWQMLGSGWCLGSLWLAVK